MTLFHDTARTGEAQGFSRRLSGMLRSTAIARFAGLLVLSLAGTATAQAQSLPNGGRVVSGGATISENGQGLTINQSSQNAAINWNSFSIGKDNQVVFVQPNSNSVALNRVIGSDPSVILGNLSANGKVFLVNPNGILFGKGSNVNVGGLVASTLGISDADFASGRYAFSGTGGAVLNQGSINADGGYVALLGASVSNQGTIQANLGTVALAAGETITLDVAGDGMLNVAIDKGAVNALVENGGLVRADGGKVLMTAQAAGALLRTAVNNTGIIEARTLETRNGTILLLADMGSGTMSVAGTLDASAPNGGDGGFIETSAAHVTIADGVQITTAAPLGKTGTWLIDPADFIIAATGGNISGATLSGQLVTSNITISTFTGPGASAPGNGDILVNDAISWTASGAPTTLTLNAHRDININAAITATNGNVVACCGRDVNVKAPITTTNGSVLLSAGQNVNVFHAITTTDGNIALCAGHDVHIDAKVTLTRGATVPAQSLGLPVGLTLISGADGTGPGAERGTIVFAPLAPPITVTKAPVTINYNPVSYSASTDFSTKFVLSEGAALTQRMLLFPTASKIFDGTNSATLNGFNTTAISGSPAGVDLVAGPDATATFDSAGEGSNIGVTFAGYSLSGANADQYALAGFCCTTGNRTTGSIAAAPPPPAPPPPAPPPPVPEPPAPPPPAPPPPAPEPPAPPPPAPPPPAPEPPAPPPPAPEPPAPPPPAPEPPAPPPPAPEPPAPPPPAPEPPAPPPPAPEPPAPPPPAPEPPAPEPPAPPPPAPAPPAPPPPAPPAPPVPPIAVVIPPAPLPPPPVIVVPPVVTPPVIVPPIVMPPLAAPPPATQIALITPLIAVPPVVIGLLPSLNLSVLDGGIKMPLVELEEEAEEPAPDIVLPVTPAPAKPIVPVRPPKQARH
jgi:filamentous hemagglutinin family protein